MSEAFWKKISWFLGMVLAAPLFGFIVLATNVEIKDLDLWLHLKTGEFILQHGFVPSVDVLSCTIAGKPWVNHEWLFQVVVQLIYRTWGGDGLINMQIGIVALTFLILLFLCYSREKQFASIFFLTLVVMVYQSRFTIRPDIFSLLFLVVYLGILARHLEKRWSPYILVVIQILWSNMHGFFFLGPLVLILAWIAEWLKRRAPLPYQWKDTGRLTDGEYRNLRQMIVLAILACLINPLTFHGAWYPLGVLFQISGDSKIFFKYIQELQRPILPETIFSIKHYLDYKLLILVSFVSFLFNRRKMDIGDFFLWLVFLCFSLAAIRNMTFFAVIACLVTMANLSGLSLENTTPFRFQEKKFHYLTAVIIKLFFIVWLLDYSHNLSYRGYFDFDRMERKSEFGGISQRNYPTKAVNFLVENKVRGNFFNDFNSGAYLIGNCFPDIKVFIDGRTEVYGADFFKMYRTIWGEDGNVQAFEDAVGKYHLTGALLNSVQVAIPEDILRYLYRSPEWTLVYFDYDAAIFLKNDAPQNQQVIENYRMDLSRWKAPPMDLLELGPRKVTPYRHVNRAYTLESLDLDEAALSEAGEALKILPGYAEPYKLLGKIYAKRKEYQLSFESFRIAAMLMPNNIETRSNLAMAYENLEDFDRAIRQYQKVIRLNPQKPAAYFRLSRAYLRAGEYARAMENLKAAQKRDPRNAVDFIKLGDLFYEKEQYGFAREAYEMAVQANPADQNRLKLIQALKALGLNEEAAKASEELNRKAAPSGHGTLGINESEAVNKELKVHEQQSVPRVP